MSGDVGEVPTRSQGSGGSGPTHWAPDQIRLGNPLTHVRGIVKFNSRALPFPAGLFCGLAEKSPPSAIDIASELPLVLFHHELTHMQGRAHSSPIGCGALTELPAADQAHRRPT